MPTPKHGNSVPDHGIYNQVDVSDAEGAMQQSYNELSLHSPLVRHAVAASLFLLSSGFAMSYSTTIVHLRMPDPKDHPPLPDIVHDNIPVINFGAFGEAIYHFTTILSICAGGYYLRRQFFPVWIRFFMAWGYGWYLRCIALFATQLPPTPLYCRDNYPIPIKSVFVNTLLGVVTGGNGNIHCGDLMFSGHTVLLIMNWMLILTYISPYNMPLAIFSTVLSISKMAIMMIERKHYSIDVLVSAYVSITLWKLTSEVLPYWLNLLSSVIARGLCYCAPQRLLVTRPKVESVTADEMA